MRVLVLTLLQAFAVNAQSSASYVQEFLVNTTELPLWNNTQQEAFGQTLDSYLSGTSCDVTGQRIIRHDDLQHLLAVGYNCTFSDSATLRSAFLSFLEKNLEFLVSDLGNLNVVEAYPPVEGGILPEATSVQVSNTTNAIDLSNQTERPTAPTSSTTEPISTLSQTDEAMVLDSSTIEPTIVLNQTEVPMILANSTVPPTVFPNQTEAPMMLGSSTDESTVVPNQTEVPMELESSNIAPTIGLSQTEPPKDLNSSTVEPLVIEQGRAGFRQAYVVSGDKFSPEEEILLSLQLEEYLVAGVGAKEAACRVYGQILNLPIVIVDYDCTFTSSSPAETPADLVAFLNDDDADVAKNLKQMRDLDKVMEALAFTEIGVPTESPTITPLMTQNTQLGEFIQTFQLTNTRIALTNSETAEFSFLLASYTSFYAKNVESVCQINAQKFTTTHTGEEFMTLEYSCLYTSRVVDVASIPDDFVEFLNSDLKLMEKELAEMNLSDVKKALSVRIAGTPSFPPTKSPTTSPTLVPTASPTAAPAPTAHGEYVQMFVFSQERGSLDSAEQKAVLFLFATHTKWFAENTSTECTTDSQDTRTDDSGQMYLIFAYSCQYTSMIDPVEELSTQFVDFMNGDLITTTMELQGIGLPVAEVLPVREAATATVSPTTGPTIYTTPAPSTAPSIEMTVRSVGRFQQDFLVVPVTNEFLSLDSNERAEFVSTIEGYAGNFGSPPFSATCTIDEQKVKTDEDFVDYFLAVNYVCLFESDSVDVSSYSQAFVEYVNGNLDTVAEDMQTIKQSITVALPVRLDGTSEGSIPTLAPVVAWSVSSNDENEDDKQSGMSSDLPSSIPSDFSSDSPSAAFVDRGGDITAVEGESRSSPIRCSIAAVLISVALCQIALL